MNTENWVAFLNDVVEALTWKRLGLLILLAASMVLLLMVFESRSTIFNKLLNTTPIEKIDIPWTVTEETKRQLVNLTLQENIVGVLLTEVDLKKNHRITKFWHAKELVFREEVSQIVTTVLPHAFFDTDKKNNQQMLAVLNNQLACNKTEDTIFIRVFPRISENYKFVCRLAVPPFSGEFAGLLEVILKAPPTTSEIDSLKIELTRLSVEMYLRDIQQRLDG